MAHIRHWVFPSHVCPAIYGCSNVSTSTHLTGPWHAYTHQSVWSVFATRLLSCGCGMHRSGSRQWEASAFHTWIGWCLQSVHGAPSSCAEVCITHPTHCVPQKCAADFWAWLGVTSCSTMWHTRWKQRTHGTYWFVIITTLSHWKRPQAISTVLTGKYGGRVNRLNRTESWDVIDIHYIQVYNVMIKYLYMTVILWI